MDTWLPSRPGHASSRDSLHRTYNYCIDPATAPRLLLLLYSVAKLAGRLDDRMIQDEFYRTFFKSSHSSTNCKQLRACRDFWGLHSTDQSGLYIILFIIQKDTRLAQFDPPVLVVYMEKDERTVI